MSAHVVVITPSDGRARAWAFTNKRAADRFAREMKRGWNGTATFERLTVPDYVRDVPTARVLMSERRVF